MRWAKVIGGVLTAVVMFLIIISGNAQALSLTLNGFPVSAVEKGAQLITLGAIIVNTGEIVLSQGELHFSGAENKTCLFNINSTLLSGCSGINVSLVSNTTTIGFGYGFGFGYGNGSTNGTLIYNITLDTTNLTVGNYNIWLSTSGFDSSIVPLTVNAVPTTVTSINIPSASDSGSSSSSSSNNVFVPKEDFVVLEPPQESQNTQPKETTPTEETQSNSESNGLTGNVIKVLGAEGTVLTGVFFAILIAGFLTSMIVNYISTGSFRRVKKILKGVSDYNY